MALVVLGGVGLWRWADRRGAEGAPRNAVADPEGAAGDGAAGTEAPTQPTEAPPALVQARAAPPDGGADDPISAEAEQTTLRQVADEGELPAVDLEVGSGEGEATAGVRGVVDYRGMLHDEVVVPTVDRRECPEHPAGTLVLHDGHLAGALVWIEGLDGAAARPRDASVLVDGCAISPRAAVVSPGATLSWSSTDDVEHRIAARDAGGAPAFRVELPPRARDVRVRVPEAGLLRVRCERHPWEQALVLVSAHAHAAVTDLDGRFDLGLVPVPGDGVATLRLLHPRLGTYEQVLDLSPHQPLEVHVDLTEQVR